MDEEIFKYRINSVHLKDGDPFAPGKINVFVGANNCGKTQLLKDMLAYITGIRTPAVVLNELEIPYPETWDTLEQAYDMKIVEANQNKQLRHISPTLDEDPTGPMSSDIRNALSYWLKSDKREFRAATGAGLVTYLNTDNRLKMVMSQPVQQNLQKRGARNALEALYISGADSTEKVRQCIKKIFDKDIFLNPFNLGNASVRLDIRRVGQIKDGEEIYGNHTRVKVVKNKVAPPFKKAEFDIMYGEGISRSGEIVDLGVEYNVIKKSGSWFSYGESKLGQGRETVKQLVMDNPELAEELTQKIVEAMENGVQPTTK